MLPKKYGEQKWAATMLILSGITVLCKIVSCGEGVRAIKIDFKNNRLRCVVKYPLKCVGISCRVSCITGN